MGTQQYTYKLVHDRDNARLKYIRISTGLHKRTILADVELRKANIQVKRLDGGRQELVNGRRTVQLYWGPGENEKVAITAGSSLSAVLEDETTLLTLDDGSAYNFAFVAATPDLAGDHLEEILYRIIRQTGFRELEYGVWTLENDSTVQQEAELQEFVGGSNITIPTNAVGATLSVEASTTSEFVRITTHGTDPSNTAQLGFQYFDKDILNIGKTPASPEGDVGQLGRIKLLGGTGIAADIQVHIIFWGLQ